MQHWSVCKQNCHTHVYGTVYDMNSILYMDSIFFSWTMNSINLNGICYVWHCTGFFKCCNIVTIGKVFQSTTEDYAFSYLYEYSYKDNNLGTWYENFPQWHFLYIIMRVYQLPCIDM